MINIFGQSISYSEILVFVMIVIAAIYVGIRNKKNNQETDELNGTVAKDLGWNVYFTTPVNFLYDYVSLTYQDYIRFFFEGIYNSFHIKLVPFYVFSGRFSRIRASRYFLSAEFREIKNRSFDFVIVSWLAYSNSTYGKYQRVKIDDDQFNQKFVIYSLRTDGSFDGLPSEAMAKLLDIKQNFFGQSLVIEVRENATLICENYQPYANYMFSQSNNLNAKKQNLIDFLEKCSSIFNLFKN